jgi:amino acid transporter
MVVSSRGNRYGVHLASYTELSTRFPVSAGEAAYVRAAFGSRLLSTLVGLSTIVIGVMSASTVTLGAVGYAIPRIAANGPRADPFAPAGGGGCVGILESVVIVGLLTLVEVGRSVAIIVAGRFCARSN